MSKTETKPTIPDAGGGLPIPKTNSSDAEPVDGFARLSAKIAKEDAATEKAEAAKGGATSDAGAGDDK